MEGWGYSAEQRRLQIRSWVVSNQQLGKSEPNVPENPGNKSWKFVLDWFRFKMFQDISWWLMDSRWFHPNGGHCAAREKLPELYISQKTEASTTQIMPARKSLFISASPFLPLSCHAESKVKTGALKHSHRLVPSPKNNVSLSWLLLKPRNPLWPSKPPVSDIVRPNSLPTTLDTIGYE